VQSVSFVCSCDVEDREMGGEGGVDCGTFSWWGDVLGGCTEMYTL